MAIETAENLEQEETQQQIPTHSREEILTRLFEIRLLIAEKESAIDSFKAQIKEVRGSIESLDKEEADILRKLESGQIVLNVSVDNAKEDDDDYPSDDELSKFDDPEKESEEEVETPLLTGDVVEEEPEPEEEEEAKKNDPPEETEEEEA